MAEQQDEENKGNVDSTGTLRLVPAFGDDGSLPVPVRQFPRPKPPPVG